MSIYDVFVMIFYVIISDFFKLFCAAGQKIRGKNES